MRRIRQCHYGELSGFFYTETDFSFIIWNLCFYVLYQIFVMVPLIELLWSKQIDLLRLFTLESSLNLRLIIFTKNPERFLFMTISGGIMKKGILVEPADSVIAVLDDINIGEFIEYKKENNVLSVAAINEIPIYHKVAIKKIAKGDRVIKYNESIGVATQDIEIGEHVHCHNIVSEREILSSSDKKNS